MGDIVFYHDINFHRYPNYILNCDQWRNLSLKVLNDLKCDIFIPSSGVTLKKDVKAYLIRKYLGEEYFEKTGLWNGLIVMRKSKTLLRFLKEWTEMSAQLDNISYLPNPNPHPEVIWHSPDQSVAGVLAHLWCSKGLLPKTWPRYEVKDRNFSEDNLWRMGSWNLDKRAKRLLLRFWHYLQQPKVIS
jgi:hypothetical protein